MPIPKGSVDFTRDNVERLIQILGVGRRNALTSPDIQRRLGLPREQTSESTRGLVLHAIEEHGVPIVSGGRGYWIAESQSEVDDYLGSLEARIVGVRNRQRALLRAWGTHQRTLKEVPMSKARWFLAHSKSEDDNDINQWCVILKDALKQDGWETQVISGRDDYATRAAALGGWKTWCKDVPCGSDYMGQPLFHGVIVPTDALIESPTVGKATSKLIEGFLSQAKHVFAWCPSAQTFRKVTGLTETGLDNWAAWSRLEFST
jgi:hypothetical protein